MTREEKKQARIERYEQYARNAETASTQAYNYSHKLVENIPFGQPILVGHHSERAHRNALDKSWNAMGKSVKLSEKAEYYERKANAAENNDAVYLEDENAVEKLTQKVEELETIQALMKAANKIVRSKKLSEAEKIEQLQKIKGISERAALKLLEPDYRGRIIGFASFQLSGNNANIRRCKERLAQAVKLKETESKEYEINGVKICENTEENRLQLFFDGKPVDEVRANLKHNGFRWSPSNGCWQSYLNRYQIGRAKQLIENI